MPIETRPAGARQFFSRHGTLSKWHPNYEYREGQVEMAEAVEAAFAEKRHLIVEAGTGTGKTLAYLVPALLSGKRIVVACFASHMHRVQQIIDAAVANNLTWLAFNGARAGQAHDACGDALRSALERLAAELSRWSRATAEIGAALRAGADRYADADLYAAARIA